MTLGGSSVFAPASDVLMLIEESVVEVMIGAVVKVDWEKMGGGNGLEEIGVEQTGGGEATMEVGCDEVGGGGPTETETVVLGGDGGGVGICS